MAHCGCGDYELTDPNGIVPLRLRTLRQQDPAFRARLQAAARRRRVEEAEEDLRRVLAETGCQYANHPLRRRWVKEDRGAFQAARVAVIDPA